MIRRIANRARRAVRFAEDRALTRSLAARPRPARPTPDGPDVAKIRPLVVIAHPDDETIGAGALLARALPGGAVWVTNGAPLQASYARRAGFDNWLSYAHARSGEALAALGLLDRPLDPLIGLGIRDQEAVCHLTPLARWLVGPLGSGFTHVVTHAYEGGHPDHDAVSFAVHAACALIAKNGGVPPVILEAPLYSGPDGEFIHQTFLAHEDAGPTFTLRLSPEEQALKLRMFACHASQKGTFEDFHVREELFRLAPRYHFSRPPHAGPAGYDNFGWPITGRRWRRLAWQAMRDLNLLTELA